MTSPVVEFDAGTLARMGSETKAAEAPALFPIFLRLRRRKVVLIGAGKVAAVKLPPLLATGAEVTVVAPDICKQIECSGARLEHRPFAPIDLDGAWLVVAAGPPDVNRRVREAAERRGVFVNAVDDPAAASAYTGGVLRRGGVTIAISTEGRAPALAGLLREALEAVLPEEIETWVAEAHRLRARQHRDGVPMARRRPLLLEALNRLYAEKAAGSLPGEAMGT